ncbi:MAG: NUMOD4 domain-containing protein [Enterococcus sp.]
MIETWKDIADYGGVYQVSDSGRVKSLFRGKERILKATDRGFGYSSVGL